MTTWRRVPVKDRQPTGNRRAPRAAFGMTVFGWAVMTVGSGGSAAGAYDREPPRLDEDSRTVTIELEEARWTGDLPGMIERRQIRVLVPYSRTFYFIDLDGAQRGLSYDFMRRFERQLNHKLGRRRLNVSIIFLPVPRDRLLTDLTAGRGDVVAADLTVTTRRRRNVDFTTPIARGIREIVVTGPGSPRLDHLDDMAGQEVFVRPGTSYRDSLLRLSLSFRERGLAPIRLRDAPAHFEAEDVLALVDAGLVPIVVSDDYLARFWSQTFTRLTLHDDLVIRPTGDIAFAVRKDSPELKRALDEFIPEHRIGTVFGNVTRNRYLADLRWVERAHDPQRLARFRKLVGLFQKYGERYSIDWLLLAAQGYQESKLDQSARSRAGAIGVMQVMPRTGKAMNVGNIRELEPNIHAGIKYVRYLIDGYFGDPGIEPLDQALFAFASYNAGPGRIESLRSEAARRGLDSDVWFDNVERVVADRIGRETVQYVSNIFKYYVAYTLAWESQQAESPARSGP